MLNSKYLSGGGVKISYTLASDTKLFLAININIV